MNRKYTFTIILFVLLLSFLAINVQAETFGDTTHGGNYYITLNRYYCGTPFMMGAEDGNADNITVFLEQVDGSPKIRCGIYTGTAGGTLTRVAQTECTTVAGDGWNTCDFITDVGLTASTTYHLVVIGDNTDDFEVGCDDSVGGNVYQTYNSAWLTCRDMFLSGTIALKTATYNVQMYCSYTVGGANDPPTQNNHTVWDGTTEKNLNATDVVIPPTCFNVTVNDTDGNLMNVSVFTNASGSWKLINQTASGMSNGTYNAFNTSFVDELNTTYYLAFNVTDNDDYVNETYHFSTLTNNAPVQSDHTVWNDITEKSLNATGVSVPPTCFNVTVNDSDGDLMNVSVFTNESGAWKLLNSTASGMSNGTFYVTNTSFVDSYSTTYYLAFNVSDNYNYINETYHFTTIILHAPVQSDHKLWCESCSDEFIFNDSDISKWITSINVTVNDSDGDYMNITVLTNVSGSWQIVNETSSGMLNGTYSAFNTSWIANYSTTYFVSFNVTDGLEWTNETYNFTTKVYIASGCDCDEIQLMLDELLDQIAELEGENVIEIEPTQFIIFIQLVLFCIFLWMGYSIPAMEGSKKSIHYMPFSGGLFVLFGGIDFISFALLLNLTYSVGYIGGYLTVIGIIILLYGGIKAFYYSED